MFSQPNAKYYLSLLIALSLWVFNDVYDQLKINTEQVISIKLDYAKKTEMKDALEKIENKLDKLTDILTRQSIKENETRR